MKKFETPIIVDVEDMAEGVYAASGSLPEEDDFYEPPTGGEQGCWQFECKWTGHNNGGHSVCHVQGTHCGDHSGNTLRMEFLTNFPIKEVKNASGLTISEVGAFSFVLTRNNHFNSNESIGFNFEIETSTVFYDEAGNPLHGAIGACNGDKYRCKVQNYKCN